MTCIPKFHLFLLHASNIFIRLKLKKNLKLASGTTLNASYLFKCPLLDS